MNECGIDYTRMRVVYDIIELSERYEGRSVFKFNRRIIDHAAERTVAAEGAAEQSGGNETEGGAS